MQKTHVVFSCLHVSVMKIILKAVNISMQIQKGIFVNVIIACSVEFKGQLYKYESVNVMKLYVNNETIEEKSL